MKSSFDALVVPGGGLTSEEQLTPRTAQRIDTAISEWWGEIFAPDVVVSGKHSFMLSKAKRPSLSEASAMKQYALSDGVPEEVVHIEDESLDTIGNALFTKTRVVVPNNWERLMVVTSESHLPRTLEIFRHVMGGDIEVDGTAVPDRVTIIDKFYEPIGASIMRRVLQGTKPGDDEAVKERLFDLVPGYAQGTKMRLMAQSFPRLLR
jgi:uncharacterized SAM-binding protein YcdF (DUF218 family)